MNRCYGLVKVLNNEMEYFKGTITLYDWNYKILVSGFYENKKEAVMLFNNWKERYLSQAHHFVIRPSIQEDRIVKYSEERDQKRKFISEGKVIPDKKIEIIRPKAVYSNQTPFGLADELHKERKVKINHKKKKSKPIKDYNR